MDSDHFETKTKKLIFKKQMFNFINGFGSFWRKLKSVIFEKNV